MYQIFGVIGGDRRLEELAKLLRRDGHRVFTYGLEGNRKPEHLERAAAAEVVILPLPLCTENGVIRGEIPSLRPAELFDRIRPGTLVLGGQVTEEVVCEAKKRGLTLVDYFRREELTVANAAATAEAAVRIAMIHRETMLTGCQCLVLGFGRIGKLLAHRLSGLRAQVTAAARKQEDLAWIRAYGWQAAPMDQLQEHLKTAQLVINTVPAPVLSSEQITLLPKDCLCIDVASVPGIAAGAAAERGITCLWERGLPGRLLPQSAAAIIRDTVYTIIKERKTES